MTIGLGRHERVYRTLLRVYPADYRRSFGDQMVQLFGDQIRVEGRARTWMRTVAELPATAISEHLRRNRTMAHSLTLAPTPTSRVLGLLGILGGGFLLLGLLGLDGWASDLFNLRLVLFNLGAIAVAVASYRCHAAASRGLALAGSVPVIVANAAYLAFTLKLVALPGDLGLGDYQPINLFILTAAAMWLSDAWFGLVTMRLGVLSRWSALALVVGSIAAFAGMGNFGLAPSGSVAETIILGGVALQGLAWILLGLDVAFRRRPATPQQA